MYVCKPQNTHILQIDPIWKMKIVYVCQNYSSIKKKTKTTSSEIRDNRTGVTSHKKIFIVNNIEVRTISIYISIVLLRKVKL